MANFNKLNTILGIDDKSSDEELAPDNKWTWDKAKSYLTNPDVAARAVSGEIGNYLNQQIPYNAAKVNKNVLSNKPKEQWEEPSPDEIAKASHDMESMEGLANVGGIIKNVPKSVEALEKAAQASGKVTPRTISQIIDKFNEAPKITQHDEMLLHEYQNMPIDVLNDRIHAQHQLNSALYNKAYDIKNPNDINEIVNRIKEINPSLKDINVITNPIAAEAELTKLGKLKGKQIARHVKSPGFFLGKKDNPLVYLNADELNKEGSATSTAIHELTHGGDFLKIKPKYGEILPETTNHPAIKILPEENTLANVAGEAKEKYQFSPRYPELNPEGTHTPEELRQDIKEFMETGTLPQRLISAGLNESETGHFLSALKGQHYKDLSDAAKIYNNPNYSIEQGIADKLKELANIEKLKNNKDNFNRIQQLLKSK